MHGEQPPGQLTYASSQREVGFHEVDAWSRADLGCDSCGNELLELEVEERRMHSGGVAPLRWAERVRGGAGVQRRRYGARSLRLLLVLAGGRWLERVGEGEQLGLARDGVQQLRERNRLE
jgi:hypothetical protein